MQFSAGMRANSRLQRLEIRFVIGESPVPGPTGKMWLEENKLIMLPAPSTSSVLIRASSRKQTVAVLGSSGSGLNE